MRILCILPDLNRCNGIVSYIMNYYYLTNHDFIKYDFLIINDEISEEYKQYIQQMNDNIITFGKIRPNNYKKKTNLINEIYKKNKYDIVYSHVLYTAWFFFFYAKKNKIKTRILHSHNTPVKNKNFIKEIIYKIMSKMSIKYATNYFACSEWAGNYLFKNRRFEVVKNAIDAKKYLYNKDIRDEYRKKLNLSDNFVIGHVGRFREQKNHQFIIDIFQEIYKKNDKAKLLLIGDGPLEKGIEEQVKTRNLQNEVVFLGVRNDINNLLQAMDVFIFPSFFEGLGIAVVEAQMSGLPCIVSTAVPKEVNFTDNVEFVDLIKKETWIQNILEKIDLKKKRNESISISETGYNIYDEESKLESLYKRIVKENSV